MITRIALLTTLWLGAFSFLATDACAADNQENSKLSHRFACTDYTQGKVYIVSAEGVVEWEYPAEHCNDLTVLPNGNLLFNTGHGVREVTRSKEVVFNYESKSTVYACQRLANGNTFVGECNSGRLLELSPSGEVVHEVRLLPVGQDGGSAYMRNARQLENGHFIVAHYGTDVVREYDETGRIVLEIPAAGGPHSVARLANGNTLISCGDHPGGPRVFETDATGKVVWEVKEGDLLGVSLKFASGFQRLNNGNTIVANWLGHGHLGEAPQLIEFTADKRVVWTYANPERMKTISNVQLIIEPGLAQNVRVDAKATTERVRNAALSMQRKSWEQGVLAVAFMEEGREDLVVQMAKASLIFRSKEGVPAALGGAPVDPLMLGEALAWAAQKTGDPELNQALEAMKAYALKTAPRAADGTVFHTGQTIWSDSYNTTPPFLAFIGEYDEALKQIEGHRKHLWNPQAKLIAHIWDQSKEKFQDPKFWGGGNGWAAASLARVIRALPPERKADREKLAGELTELIDGCLAHQTANGLFHDIVDDPTTFEETNLAQMLAYAIYESVRGSWLPREYLKTADRMRTAAKAKVDAEGFVHDVSGAPEFKRPGISAEGQAFFLMMEAAEAKLAR